MIGCNNQSGILPTEPILNTPSPLVKSPTTTSLRTPTFETTASPTIEVQEEIATETIQPTSTAIPTIDVLKPNITQLCPDNSEVQWSDLDIDPSYRLFLADFDEESPIIYHGLYTLGSNNPQPVKFPIELGQNGWSNLRFIMSKDYSWIAFQYQKGWFEFDDSLWIISTDGKQKWNIENVDISDKNGIFWEQNNEIVITGIRSDDLNRERQVDYPLRIIDPFSHEVTQLPPIPSNAEITAYYYDDAGLNVLYYTGLNPIEDFRTYNYQNEVETKVLSWLSDRDGVDFHSTGVDIVDGYVFIQVYQSVYEYIDIGYIGLDELQDDFDYNQVMHRILPTNFGRKQSDDAKLIRRGNVFGEKQFFILERFKDAFLQLYDSENNILKEYCLPLSADIGWLISPDGRYIAMDIYPDSDSELPPTYVKEVIVLDLETGKQFRIQGMKMLSWGIVDD